MDMLQSIGDTLRLQVETSRKQYPEILRVDLLPLYTGWIILQNNLPGNVMGNATARQNEYKEQIFHSITLPMKDETPFCQKQ
jgi:hypothetical protein